MKLYNSLHDLNVNTEMKGTPSLAKWISQVSAVRVLSAKRTCLSIRLTLSIEFGGGGY